MLFSKSNPYKIKITSLKDRHQKEKTWKFSFPPFMAIAIGRIDGCHIVLEEPTVSNSHCLIYPQENKLCITDLGSKYGTSVNQQQISSVFVLPAKGTLELGRAKLQFHIILPKE